MKEVGKVYQEDGTYYVFLDNPKLDSPNLEVSIAVSGPDGTGYSGKEHFENMSVIDFLDAWEQFIRNNPKWINRLIGFGTQDDLSKLPKGELLPISENPKGTEKG